jgi:diphthamide biosynthesis methyltransferase
LLKLIVNLKKELLRNVSLQEEYTSILTCGKAELEEFYGRELIAADRDLVEQGADEILDGADTGDVGFLVRCLSFNLFNFND